MYFIWSREHVAWWAPRRLGYVYRLADAGRYTFEEAAEITIDHIPPGEEVAVSECCAQQWENNHGLFQEQRIGAIR